MRHAPAGLHHCATPTRRGQRLGYAPSPEQVEHGTSHISVINAYGNALAMTTTIEDGWGSRLMVNRVEPGKRPRSSMSPTLVFDKSTGQLVASAGSPGGAFIIHFTAKTLVGMLNWELNAQQAIDLPNFGTLGGPLMLEEHRFAPTTMQALQALQARGHTVVQVPLPSGLQAIQRTATGYFGGADPRRKGVVLGD